MKFIRRSLCLSIMALAVAGTAAAQETETKVVDEVVAQVNDGVLTLSRIKREKKFVADSYRQEGKTPEEAARMVDEKQGEIIANLINEELLIQKAKEVGLDAEIEASVNARFVDFMKQNNVKTLEALYEIMRAQNLDPDEIRQNIRKQATRERVIQREVQSKVYWQPSGSELKAYFEKNKSKFIKPESVSISEIYLGFAGRDENSVRAKAKQVYDELLKGGDFAKLAKENDPGLVTDGQGKAENLPVKDLNEKIQGPLKNIKVGEYTLPFEIEQYGMVILRVDSREQGGGVAAFDEDMIRRAILQDKFPEEAKKFMSNLRTDAYIKISETYRPIVSPILFADERKEKPTK